MRFLVLYFALALAIGGSLRADDTASPDARTRSDALRTRGLEREKNGDWEGAIADYIASWNAAQSIDNSGRKAEMYARTARVQVKLGAFDAALDNLQKCRKERAWSDSDWFYLDTSAIVLLANERFDEALEVARTLKNLPKESAKTRGDFYEASALYLKGDPASLQMGLGPKLFDPLQLPFNAAIARDPKNIEARLSRAKFFTDRALQKRWPDRYAPQSPTTQGGWLNLIDIGIIDVQPHTFSQAAYFDFSRLVTQTGKPEFYAKRAQAGAAWNAVASKTDKLPQPRIQADLDVAINNGTRDAATQRALGEFFGDNLPDYGTPEFKKMARGGVRFYSRALYLEPNAPENEEIKAARGTLLAFALSAKPVSPPNPKPATPLAWKEYGNQLNEKNELDAALDAYQKALELDPKFADAQNNIGHVYSKLDALDLALEWMTKALQTNPKHRIAFQNRANVFLRLGDREKAVQDFDSALQLAPADSDLWALKGQTELELERWFSGLEALQKAANLNPQNTKLKAFIALADFVQNNKEPQNFQLSPDDQKWWKDEFDWKKWMAIYAKMGRADRVARAREWVK